MCSSITLAKQRDEWTFDEINKVIKQLKVNKAANPLRLASELFKPGVSCTDLVNSVLVLCNMIRN